MPNNLNKQKLIQPIINFSSPKCLNQESFKKNFFPTVEGVTSKTKISHPQDFSINQSEIIIQKGTIFNIIHIKKSTIDKEIDDFLNNKQGLIRPIFGSSFNPTNFDERKNKTNPLSGGDSISTKKGDYFPRLRMPSVNDLIFFNALNQGIHEGVSLNFPPKNNNYNINSNETLNMPSNHFNLLSFQKEKSLKFLEDPKNHMKNLFPFSQK